jgi:ABC-type multidrug transport system fused ATPase/permease subunit
VSIDIQRNKVIALVGPSGKNSKYFIVLGCGKSSIISMIERFYDPVSGQVFFDGIDIKTLNPRWYH